MCSILWGPSGCINFPNICGGKVIQPLGPHRSTKTEWLYSLSISPWKGHTATRFLYFGGWLGVPTKNTVTTLLNALTLISYTAAFFFVTASL